MKYAIQANIRKDKSVEIFRRDFEEDGNINGEAVRKACELVIDRILEGDNWYLVSIHLMSIGENGIPGTVDITLFDLGIAMNVMLKKIREKVI